MENMNLLNAKIAMEREKFSPIKRKTSQGGDEKLMHACKEFESLLLNQILKEMRETVQKDGIFPESQGENIWQSVYDEKLSIQIAGGNNNVGLSNFLYNQLKSEPTMSIRS